MIFGKNEQIQIKYNCIDENKRDSGEQIDAKGPHKQVFFLIYLNSNIYYLIENSNDKDSLPWKSLLKITSKIVAIIFIDAI